MSTGLTLEEFSKYSPNTIENFNSELDSNLINISRVSENIAFEKGYKAGWDDASEAEEKNQNRISEDFARNLQDLGFTYHEARNHVLHSLENLLTELIEKILPNIAFDNLGLTVIEEIMPLAKLASDIPIEILVSPLAKPKLEALLGDFSTVQLDIIEEASLSSGQVFLRAGKFEKQIDFSNVLKTASSALLAVHQVNEQALKHG